MPDWGPLSSSVEAFVRAGISGAVDFAFQPADSYPIVFVERGDVGLDVQKGGAIHDIQVSDVKNVAVDALQGNH